MAKKKKPTQAPLLSPENYIRQKARNLPITECWINSDWEKSKFAHIIVARSHTNGNLTVGLYMIDLGCVGVKDAHYKFNLSPLEFRELLEKFSVIDVIKVDYVLVHNIIFAAEAYAADLGLKPHKDFQLAKYILEEDTDEIELMDIACGGENGRPLLVVSNLYTKAETQKIIAQLEKSVGEDNFDVIVPTDDFEDDFEIDDNDELTHLSFEEKRDLFMQIDLDRMDDFTVEERTYLVNLTNHLYLYEVCDDNLVDELIDAWEVENEMEIVDDEFTTELLGLNADRIITKEDEAEFKELKILLDKDPQKGIELLRKLFRKWGEIPYLCNMDLHFAERTESIEYESKLAYYSTQFPDYPLLKLYLYSTEKAKMSIPDFQDIFKGRSSVTDFEMFKFQTTKLQVIFEQKDLNAIEAMDLSIESLGFDEVYSQILDAAMELSRIALLKDYLLSTL